MLDLKDKRIIITGASSGIGRQLAFDFAKLNAKLVLVSRNKENLKKVADQIASFYPSIFKPLYFACDVTSEEEIKDVINAAVSELEEIDILINNAGIGIYGPIKNTTPTDFKRIMDVNFQGAVNFTLNTIPYINSNSKTCVVFISSVASLYGIPLYSAYSASKAALKSFSQSLRAEIQNPNLNILHISPDYTKTRFFRNEKFIEGASLHRNKMASVEMVSKKIVNDIIYEKNETIISFRGKLLRISNLAFPKLTQLYFKLRASKLIFKTR